MLLIVGLRDLPSEVAGLDFRIYQDRARDFVEGRGFYLPRQLAGPYVIANGDSLYPPPMVLLVVPFLWLPAILWWAIPVGVIAYVLWRLRPPVWTWPLLALCYSYPIAVLAVLKGNPNLWIAAAMAVATLWRPTAVLVLLKPSLAPLALYGAGRRSWWVALGALTVVSLLFGAMWLDYVRVIRDSGGSLLYSLVEVPFVAAPLIPAVLRDLRQERPGLDGYLILSSDPAD